MRQPILEALERCQRRFPTVRVSMELFESRINQILSELPIAGDTERREAFSRLHHEDLYLAIACAHGDRIAWEYFADDYVPVIKRFACRACSNPGDAEDLGQEITARLMKDSGRLAGYNGRGSLAGWLRVAVSHAAIDRFRRTSRMSSLEQLQENGTAVLSTKESENEGDALDSQWGPVMARTAENVLKSLPARDRLLLSLYYLRGLSLKEISVQFGIHEATASRWLEKMRLDIRKQIERELHKKHRLTSSEIKSLWKWVPAATVAESVMGKAGGLLSIPLYTGDEANKKAAIEDNSGVIKKEELQ